MTELASKYSWEDGKPPEVLSLWLFFFPLLFSFFIIISLSFPYTYLPGPRYSGILEQLWNNAFVSLQQTSSYLIKKKSKRWTLFIQNFYGCNEILSKTPGVGPIKGKGLWIIELAWTNGVDLKLLDLGQAKCEHHKQEN